MRGNRFGAPVQMMQLKNGIYDDASISVIALHTVHEIARLAGTSRPTVLKWRQRYQTHGLAGLDDEDG